MMKKINIIIFKSAFTVLIFLSSFVVSAEKSHQQKYEAALGKQMQVKCHVEYLGGGYDIQFSAGSYNKAAQAIRTLQGKKVIKNNAQSKKTIIKVNECVESNKQFSKAQYRQLDKVKAR